LLSPEHHRRRCDEILPIENNGAMTAYEIASQMTIGHQVLQMGVISSGSKVVCYREAISHLEISKEGTDRPNQGEQTYLYHSIDRVPCQGAELR
jgi:hypothetical protein